MLTRPSLRRTSRSACCWPAPTGRPRPTPSSRSPPPSPTLPPHSRLPPSPPPPDAAPALKARAFRALARLDFTGDAQQSTPAGLAAASDELLAALKLTP